MKVEKRNNIIPWAPHNAFESARNAFNASDEILAREEAAGSVALRWSH